MSDLPSPTMIAAYQALRFLNPVESYYWAYLVGALIFAAGVMLWRRRRRRRVRARALLRLLGSRRLWLHRSTLLDLKLHLMHGVLLVAAYGALQAASQVWQAGTMAVLTAVAGRSPEAAAPAWLVGGATTVAAILALELGYWAMHYAFHKVPALWELHKVHHSAEVMTPLTEWRQHPIEFIVFGNVITFTTGAAYGVMAWVFGPGAVPFTLFQVNILLVLHFATFHHLRHSGVWIAATGWLGRVVHSPAHHQIHHSSDPRHFDCNMGYALSIWDWVFGTLYVPERRGAVRLGVTGEAPYRGVADTLIRPLAAMARSLSPGSGAGGATRAGDGA